MIYLGIILCCLVLFTVIYAVGKNKKPFKRALISMILGVLSLVAVHISGKYLGISVEISPLSLTISACGGVPSVAAMVIINAII